MAKRELIDKYDAMAICMKSWDASDAAQNIKDEQPITEREIVKPYLDKLKTEIRKLDDINPDYPMDRTIHISRNEVLELIDSILSEQEGDAVC